MDAYVLGKLEGDLPKQLLQSGSPTNGVRVMARLDGPAHDVYFALVAPDQGAIEILTHELSELGVREITKLTRDVAGPAHKTGKVNPFPGTGPSYAEPLMYVIFELWDLSDLQVGVEIGEALFAAGQASGGDERIGAAMDDKNRLLVELTSDNKDLLTSAAAALHDRFGGSESGTVWVRDGLAMRSGGVSSG